MCRVWILVHIIPVEMECVYCYATKEKGRIEEAFSIKDNSSPILCDRISERDHMIERKVQSSVSKRYIKK